MTTLKMTLSMKDRGKLDMKARIRSFSAQVSGAERAAATMATRTSRSSFKRTRPIAPPRPGRHGQGKMINSVVWAPRADGTVGLRQQELNKAAPHWIIQEIGTGERAVTRVANSPRPQGRPAKGASYVRTVPSQRGRRISSGLVFASRNGVFTPPGAARGQQLYLRRQVQGVPATRTKSQASIVINREIKGQHFVKKGGESGFREYRESVLAAARQQFRKGRG
jgi:hypothetical protein